MAPARKLETLPRPLPLARPARLRLLGPLPVPREEAALGVFQIVWLLGALTVCRAFASYACHLYDDAFITMRYARNLAAGQGFVFNPGESWEPVLGTTTPLFGVILAAFAQLGVAIPAASFGISLVCDLAIALLLIVSLRRRPVAAFVTVLALAALPQLARVAVGGMEVSLFAAAGLAAAVANERGRTRLAGFAAALCACVRPEGAVLVLVLLAENWRQPRRFLDVLVPALVIGLSWMTLLLASFGTFLPQSITAKVTVHQPSWSRWGRILQNSFLPHVAYLPLLPLVALGAVRALGRRGALRTFSLFALGIVGGYLVARPNTWGWYYFVPLVAWVTWLGLGVHELVRFAGGPLLRMARVALSPAGALFATATVVGLVGVVGVRRPSPVVERVYEPMREWAAETARTQPEARVLASDIGAIAWAWPGTVLDSLGLTWPEALEHESLNALIAAHEPDYVLMETERIYMAPFLADQALASRYAPVRRFSARGETSLHPPQDAIDELWVQDYVLYRKVGAGE